MEETELVELNRIYNEDCLSGLTRVKSNSVTTIVTDPPYCLGMTHNGQKGTFSDLAIAKPFYTQLFKEFKRVLKADGSFYWFCDWKSFAFYFPIIEGILGVDNLLVWDKENGPGSFYTNCYELCVFYTNDRHFCHKGCTNILRGIKSFAGGAKQTNGDKVHPTQKPVELIQRLIVDSSQEGDTVLDCFMGGGTTAIASIRANRNYIGFELQAKYCEVAEQRISSELAQTQIIFPE